MVNDTSDQTYVEYTRSKKFLFKTGTTVGFVSDYITLRWYCTKKCYVYDNKAVLMASYFIGIHKQDTSEREDKTKK